jgi:lysophospholipid acyltransferase (LPLAT)-like uncharacterized protein
MLRRKLRRRLRNWLLSRLGPPLIHWWARSLRLRFLGDICRDGHLPATRQNGIFVFWHQRLLGFGGYFRNSGFRVLISKHQDGEMIAAIIDRLGMKSVRGSSRRGGVQALRGLLQEDLARVNFAITPDGPRGPRHVFQAGAVYLASRTGLPVYPTALAYARSLQLPTWDGFILPRPFTRALLCAGKPHCVPADLDRDGIEEWRTRLERSLLELTEEADRDFAKLHARALRLRDLPARGEGPVPGEPQRRGESESPSKEDGAWMPRQ